MLLLQSSNLCFGRRAQRAGAAAVAALILAGFLLLAGAALAQTAAPTPPPALRSLLWLAGVGVAIALAVLGFANLGLFAARYADPRRALECAAIALTAVTAVVAAFHLSLPDRSSLWRYAPLPPLALWIATSGLGCLRYGLGVGAPGERLGESPHCFAFIVAVSVPLA